MTQWLRLTAKPRLFGIQYRLDRDGAGVRHFLPAPEAGEKFRNEAGFYAGC